MNDSNWTQWEMDRARQSLRWARGSLEKEDGFAGYGAFELLSAFAAAVRA